MSDNDVLKGREAYNYFWNEVQQYIPSNITATSYLDRITGSARNSQIFLDGLGFAINQIAENTYFMSSKVQNAMEKLANDVKNKVPNKNLFFDYLRDQSTQTNIIEALPSVVSGSAETLVQGAQQVGNAVIDTGKSLLTVMPLALTAAALFLLWSYTKKVSR